VGNSSRIEFKTNMSSSEVNPAIKLGRFATNPDGFLKFPKISRRDVQLHFSHFTGAASNSAPKDSKMFQELRMLIPIQF
jgi:hypothetical protein